MLHICLSGLIRVYVFYYSDPNWLTMQTCTSAFNPSQRFLQLPSNHIHRKISRAEIMAKYVTTEREREKHLSKTDYMDVGVGQVSPYCDEAAFIYCAVTVSSLVPVPRVRAADPNRQRSNSRPGSVQR